MERTSDNNTIGGTNSVPGVLNVGNLLSGNTGDGIQIIGTSNFVQGNFIGTDPTGTFAIPNAIGVSLEDDPDDSISSGAFNTIGGTNFVAGTLSVGNLISGNTGAGISLGDLSSQNVVLGNFIGTDPTGTVALPNGADGIDINATSAANTIGGTNTTPGQLNVGNLISGNTGYGVDVNGTDNVLLGNYIGTDVTGTVALPNTLSSVNVRKHRQHHRRGELDRRDARRRQPDQREHRRRNSAERDHRQPGPGELHRDRRLGNPRPRQRRRGGEHHR